MCVGHGQEGMGGGGGGGMGAAAAVLHEGMRVPLSSRSIQSKHLHYLMKTLYTKVNGVCMYECIACTLTCIHAYTAVFVFLK